jgi:predicted oxidoreductase
VANNTVTDSVAKGQPKGTTIKHAKDLKCQIELASKDAAEKFSKERKRNKQYSRTKRGILKDINQRM